MPASVIPHNLLALALALFFAAAHPLAPRAAAQPEDPLDVLVVTAHPDDETLMAGTIYKLAHDLGAHVDLAIVTDGSGGFSYSMIGERFYGLPITEERDARRNLPLIRKQEVIGAARILGIRNIFFLDELDHQFTVDADTVLQHVWDADAVRDRLGRILRRVSYDVVLTFLPTPQTHGHHKSATILALEAIAELPLDQRPLVLGSDLFDTRQLASPETPPNTFTGLDGYPLTAVDPKAPILRFDRLQPLEPDGLLDYKFVANWALAEHKSQGSLAGYFGWGDYEFFWVYALNEPSRIAQAEALFARLDENPWREGRRYGGR